jgi:ATP-dependent HslUV protease ATP-binding subunit HslU
MENLTPQQIVAVLDRYIVGQADAKRAVAVALRNRYRRQQLDDSIRKDITPKNILMIGPTGVGKTEIARQVARMIGAPMLKVEATKYTEVGYVGRDVESIIQELVETSVNMVHEERMREVQARAEGLAAERIVNYLCQQINEKGINKKVAKQPALLAQQARGGGAASAPEAMRDEHTVVAASAPVASNSNDQRRLVRQRKRVTDLLNKRQLEDAMIEIELNADLDAYDSVLEFTSGMSTEEMTDSFNDFIHSYNTSFPRKKTRKVSVREARRILTREEANKLIDFDEVMEDAVRRTEESAVVFIDELDKIIGPKVEMGADVSGEGVQRDLLPIVEGTSVMTRYGPVKTDYILFIGAGAFYAHKPSELIPELQGRFPLRVELNALGQKDFERILTEPDNSLIKQYKALLSTEDVKLEFTPEAIEEMSRVAQVLNERQENIGARRLHTIMEKNLEEISFDAPDHQGETVVIDREYVKKRLSGLVQDEDLSKYIL